MARVYGVNYNYSQSISELRLAVQEEPDNALAWDMLSWALGYETPPDPVESEKAAREAIASIRRSATRHTISGGLSIFRVIFRKQWLLLTGAKSCLGIRTQPTWAVPRLWPRRDTMPKRSPLSSKMEHPRATSTVTG